MLRTASGLVISESTGLSGASFGGSKIPPVSLLNGRHLGGGIKTPDSLGSNSDATPSESEARSSVCGQGGINPFQPATASPRHITTSPASGRDAILPSQQRCVRSHRESENPMAEAFSGLLGRVPRSTWCAKADCRILRNGMSPERTWGDYT